jgi:hypothetical protein
VGFVVDKVALGQVFLRVLRFPLPIFIPPISPQSPSPIIRGWYNRAVMAAVPKVPPHKLKKKKLERYCYTNHRCKIIILFILVFVILDRRGKQKDILN